MLCETSWHLDAAEGKADARCVTARGELLGIQRAERRGGHSAPSRPSPWGRVSRPARPLGFHPLVTLDLEPPCTPNSGEQLLPPPAPYAFPSNASSWAELLTSLTSIFFLQQHHSEPNCLGFCAGPCPPSSSLPPLFSALGRSRRTRGSK